MKQVWVLLFFPVLMQSCFRTCDCFDDCAEVITFQLDTAVGQFNAKEIKNLEIHIQLENENQWRISKLDTNFHNNFTFDSTYFIISCGGPLRENLVQTEIHAFNLSSKERVKIQNIRFVTKSDTASLFDLDLAITKAGRINCKCISSLTFKYNQGGGHYAIKSEASRHHIITKVQVD